MGAMDPLGFSIGVASELTGLTQRQIRHLAAGGVIKPSIRPPKGRGSVARYSYFDLLRLKVVERLRAAGDVAPERLRLAMAELGKVRDGGWDGCLLHTADWETFDLARSAAELDGRMGTGPLWVLVALGPIDRELRDGLARMSLGAPVSAAAA